MKNLFLTLNVGLALFAMFFGSGNLVFPLLVGQESGGHPWPAALGIISTGVVVPFLGVFGMILYKGDFAQFFSCLGKKGTFWFSLFCLSLMGPFGVLARCFTVAHGAVTLLLPDVSLYVMSGVFCVVIFLFARKKHHVLTHVGIVLTPFLLLAIGAIAYFGFTSVEAPPVSSLEVWTPFYNGFSKGYQMMDLLAAFFFSAFTLKTLQSQLKEVPESESLRFFVKGSLIGAGLLTLVYGVLVGLGWHFAPRLEGIPPQELLGKIALDTLGHAAGPVVCTAIVLACLTTAIALTLLFADFLRKEVLAEKITVSSSLIVTLLIAFGVSSFEFSGIARFLAPLMEIIYPSLIALTVANIVEKKWGFRTSHWPATVTLALKIASL